MALLTADEVSVLVANVSLPSIYFMNNDMEGEPCFYHSFLQKIFVFDA